ncbi:MAG TPA: glycosyltransferase family 9 protein [Thermoanaerobaculia bacterium]|nr:glycosyltransferase family 9 protein [Thermoanaerobaculia bacterium]
MRILIVKTSALGDVVHALPVLGALRRHFKTARIAWVVEQWIAPLLAGHPDLDEVIPVRLGAWRKRPFARATLSELGRLRSRVADFAPDVALDLMGNHKAGVLAALSFADRRLGLAREFRREPSSAIWINEGVPLSPDQNGHAVDRMLAVLGGLGLPQEPAEFQPEKILAGPDAEIPGGTERPADPPDRFALLHPGAGWGNKRYPAGGWGRALQALAQESGLPSLVAVGPGEEPLAAEIVAASGGAARSVPAEIPAFAALARRAQIVLGGDSGPTHLAHALGRPVLMVMGPTDPALHGPYGAPHLALAKRLPCSYCHRRFAEVKACLLEIAPREVAARAGEILRSTGFSSS